MAGLKVLVMLLWAVAGKPDVGVAPIRTIGPVGPEVVQAVDAAVVARLTESRRYRVHVLRSGDRRDALDAVVLVVVCSLGDKRYVMLSWLPVHDGLPWRVKVAVAVDDGYVAAAELAVAALVDRGSEKETKGDQTPR